MLSTADKVVCGSMLQMQNELMFSAYKTAEQIRASFEIGLNSEVLVERQNAMLDLELQDLRAHFVTCSAVFPLPLHHVARSLSVYVVSHNAPPSHRRRRWKAARHTRHLVWGTSHSAPQ